MTHAQSSKTRLLIPPAEVLPDWLLDQECWVVWGGDLLDAEKGKYAKPPRAPDGSVCGALHFVSDHREAEQRATRLAGTGTLDVVGLGIVPGRAGLSFIDLDGCYPDPPLNVVEFIADLDTYTEHSPSGRGARLILQGSLGVGQPKLHGLGIEAQVFDESGYCTITGDVISRPREFRNLSSGELREKLLAMTKTPGKVVSIALPPDREPKRATLDDAMRLVEYVDWDDADRSREVTRIATELLVSYDREDVFAALWQCSPVCETAMSKRGGEPMRAQEWLWQHVVLKTIADHPDLQRSGGAMWGDPGQGYADVVDDLAERVQGAVEDPLEHWVKWAQDLQHPEPTWLVEGLLERGGMHHFFGHPEGGKSLAAQAIAVGLSQGEVFGRAVHEAYSEKDCVVYLLAEGHSGFQARLMGLGGVDTVEEIAQFRIAVTEFGVNLDDGEMAKRVTERLKRMVAGYRVVALVIDTQRAHMRGTDSSDQDTEAALRHVRDILGRGLRALTTIVIHHVGHGDDERGRGSSNIKAVYDLEWQVRRCGGGVFRMSCKKWRNGERERLEDVVFRLRDGWRIEGATREELITVLAIDPDITERAAAESLGVSRARFVQLRGRLEAEGKLRRDENGVWQRGEEDPLS